MIRLDGKIALVTGAGSGIGQCIAETFARAGARVIVAELRVEAGEATVQRIREAGGQAESVALDVTSESDVLAAAARHPVVDVLVCNAGIGHVGTLLTTTGADFDRVMGVNVRGVFNTMKAWLPGMVSRGAGSVVNLASTAGLEGLVDRFAGRGTFVSALLPKSAPFAQQTLLEALQQVGRDTQVQVLAVRTACRPRRWPCRCTCAAANPRCTPRGCGTWTAPR